MHNFALIETDDGLTVVELQPGQTADDSAAIHGGTLVDPGPYPSYDEAYDALADLQAEEEQEQA